MSENEYQPIQTDMWRYRKVMNYAMDPPSTEFIFRGTGDSEYPLVPYLYREKKAGDKEYSGREIVEAEARAYIRKQSLFTLGEEVDMGIKFYEVASLLWFYDKANRQGLPLPDIPRTTVKNEFLDADKQSKRLTNESYILEWSGIAAVAQHYGIPTRMLDWTFDVNVALYFAVKNLPDKKSRKKHPKFVSLWILNKSKISMISDKIWFVLPRYSDNPNIGAQSGLFSVLTGDDPGKDLEVIVAEAYRNTDPGRLSVLNRDGAAILKKINIPYQDAIKIKENFENRDISYDSIFPGWSGVVRSMEIESGIRKA